MNPFLRVAARWMIPLALVGLAAGLVAVNLSYVKAAPASNDFVARWEGGRAWVSEKISPYDPLVSQRAQERVYGRPANTARGEDPEHFLYPFPSLVIFAPLGLLDLGPAQAVWMSLIEVALVAATLLWVFAVRWKWSPWMAAATLAFTALWYPAFATLVSAQFAALEALLLAGALAAICSQRDAVAGLLMAGTLFKPQLGLGFVLYVVVWAIASRRRQLLGWLLTGFVALLGASLILEPGWLLGMARQVLDYVALPISLSPLGRLMEALGVRGTAGTLILSGALLLYLVWEWRDSLRGDERRFLWTVGMTQAVVLLVAPFGIAANLVTLVFALVVMLEAWSMRQGRSVEAAAIVILILVAAFSWLVSVQGLQSGEPSLWLLIGGPVLTMVGLLWVRWWTTRARYWSELEGRRP